MRTFLPSEVGVPHKMLFRCDKQCSEKSLSDWHLASVVVHGGDEAYTTNLYQKCLDKSLQAKGFSGCMGQCASTHLLKKEPRVLSELVRFGPSISAEKMKACALIVMAEENACRSDSGSSVSSRGSCDGNVGNDALHIIGPHGSADTISLFFQDWEVAKVAFSCHIALDRCARKCMKSKGDVAGLVSEQARQFCVVLTLCPFGMSKRSVSNGFGCL